MVTLRVRALRPAQLGDATSWLMADAGGAMHVVRVPTQNPDPMGKRADGASGIEAACAARLRGVDARRVAVAVYRRKASPSPILLIGATADHRADAFRAVDACLSALDDAGCIRPRTAIPGRERANANDVKAGHDPPLPEA